MAPRTRIRFPVALLLCGTLVEICASSARADELDCDRRWSVLDPTPRACLGPIETDRPHLTETPYPVAAGHVQLESGLVLLDVFQDAETVFFFENIYKIGLASGVDLELLHTHLALVEGSFRFTREEPLVVRAKILLMEGDGTRPAMSLVPVVQVPLVARDAVESGLLAFAAWELPRGAELELNVGATIRAQRPVRSASLLAATALTFPLAGAVDAFTEVFSVGPHDPSGPWDVLAGAGLLWLVHRDVQLDAGVWVGITGDVSPVIPFVGASVRR